MSNNAITTGVWVRIVSGPLHRKDEERTGVVDGERDYPSGRCYRVIHPHTKQNWGWINERDLRTTIAPAYTSQVPESVQQDMLARLMGRRAS